MFQSNQSKFYQKFDRKLNEENLITAKEENKWKCESKRKSENNVKHDESADWFKNVAQKVQDKMQQNIKIIPIKVKKIPINCLSPMWKLLTRIVVNGI